MLVLSKNQEKNLMFENKKVYGVYRGIDGRCCCGCSGIHRYTSSYSDLDDYQKVNDSYVKKIVEALENNPDAKDMGGYVEGIDEKGKLMLAYYLDDESVPSEV
jgi:hypothetical protein